MVSLCFRSVVTTFRVMTERRTYEDILNQSPCVFDPENAVCTKLNTHNAIHYGDESLLVLPPVQRTQNDTCPWRK